MKILEYIKSWLIKPKVEVKSINLLTPYILIINFREHFKSTFKIEADHVVEDKKVYKEWYLILHGNYKAIRSKHLKRLQIEEGAISFEEFMEEINLLIPAEDIVLNNKLKWKTKL